MMHPAIYALIGMSHILCQYVVLVTPQNAILVFNEFSLVFRQNYGVYLNEG